MPREGFFDIRYKESEPANGYWLYYTDSKGKQHRTQNSSANYRGMITYYLDVMKGRMPKRVCITTGRRWYERVDVEFMAFLARKLNERIKSENRFYVDESFRE